MLTEEAVAATAAGVAHASQRPISGAAAVGIGVAGGALAALTSKGGRRTKHGRREPSLMPRKESEASTDPVEIEQGEEEEGSWGKKFDWNKAWYPLAVIADLEHDRPSKLQLLGQDLVAWKDGNGEWRVFEDRCPHRNVPLSEGRVESDGTLMCTYHGWRFNGEGRATAIPQAPKDRAEQILQNPRACAAARPAQVREGVLWVWGESSPDAALESALVELCLPEELSDPELEGRASTSVWSHRDIPYGWEVAMENVTDPAHVAVAHHNIVSNRYVDPAPIEISFVRKPTNMGGFKVQTTPHHTTQPQGSIYEGRPTTTMDFKPPHQMHIKSAYENGTSLTLLINFVPTKPGWSRLVGSTMMVKNEKGEKPPGFAIYSNPLPRWVLHLLAPAFLHQDQVFLHFQQAILQKETAKTGQGWKQSYWMPCEADKGTITLRRWLDKNDGIAWHPSCATDLAAMPDKQLLFDTYKTHTQQCATCSKALKNVSRVQSTLKYSAIILASVGLSSTSWPMLAGGAVLGLGAGVTSKLKGMFYEVPFHHQDNN